MSLIEKPNKHLIPSVNYHFWQPCNMRCKFCFATYHDVKKQLLPKGHLPKEKSLELIGLLADYGFKKITFVGGEPTLCHWLDELILYAKEKGFTTMIVTNGSTISEKKLMQWQGILDWITLSIDSLNDKTNKLIGRKENNNTFQDVNRYRLLIEQIKFFNFRLKVNTVVNKYNYKEIVSPFIKEIEPERWKIFKALRIEGQNDKYFSDVSITNEEFTHFLHINHTDVISQAVVEYNEDMRGSYVMIDPAGRFFDNTKGKHTYSSSILESNVEFALSQVSTNYTKFIERGGVYKW
jgi:radical S-adenosyl methionine domain-containing protein 2